MPANINIYGTIRTMAEDGIAAVASQVKDEELGKFQSEINQEIKYKDAKTGYAECSTSSSTAEKTVSITGFSLDVHCLLRIKMANKNTADNVTLNISSTGAKPLYYGKLRAGSANTWTDGEVLDIFYDGTSFYANDFTGSVTAEDESQSANQADFNALADTVWNKPQSLSAAQKRQVRSNIGFGDGDIDTTATKDGKRVINSGGVFNTVLNVLLLSDLNEIATSYFGTPDNVGNRYTVINNATDRNIVGILDVISDADGHVITQILATHYDFNNGVLQPSSHSDENVRLMYRSIKINGGTLPDTTWTTWKEINHKEDIAAVLYTTQTLSESQQKRARTNINAASADALPTEEVQEDGFYVTDSNGNVVIKYTASNGFDVPKIGATLQGIIEALIAQHGGGGSSSLGNVVYTTNEDGVYIVDEAGYIGRVLVSGSGSTLYVNGVRQEMLQDTYQVTI